MKKMLLFIFLSVSYLNLFAQAVEIKSAGNALYKGYFFNDNAGWVCNMDGFVMQTQDGGKTWTYHYLTEGKKYLYDIKFFDNITGAVSSSGMVYSTQDGGFNWNKSQVGSQELYSVAYQDKSKIWAVGAQGNIFVSQDGGKTWTDKSYQDKDVTFYDIRFVNSQVGYISGSKGTVLQTTNGGQTWTNSPVDVAKEDFGRMPLKSFLVGSLGVGVYTKSNIAISSNGGKNWTYSKIVLDGNIADIHFIDDKKGFCLSSEGDLFKTTNGGVNWVQIQNRPYQAWYYSDLHVFNENNLIIVGERGVEKTQNGGINWVYMRDLEEIHTDIAFTSTQNGWIVGRNRDNTPLLKMSKDAGNTWTNVKTCATAKSGSLNAMSAVNDKNVWGVGSGGVITKFSLNGVQKTATGSDITCQVQKSGTTKDLMDVFFVNEKEGWAVGYNGTLLYTNNGGMLWTPRNVGVYDKAMKANDHLYGVFFLNKLEGWIIGGYFQSFILKTTDGGKTWKRTDLGVNAVLNSIYFSDAKNGFILGMDKAFTTTDGGMTWTPQEKPKNLAGDYIITPNYKKATDGVGAIEPWNAKDDIRFRHKGTFLTDTNQVWVVGGSSIIQLLISKK